MHLNKKACMVPHRSLNGVFSFGPVHTDGGGPSYRRRSSSLGGACGGRPLVLLRGSPAALGVEGESGLGGERGLGAGAVRPRG